MRADCTKLSPMYLAWDSVMHTKKELRAAIEQLMAMLEEVDDGQQKRGGTEREQRERGFEGGRIGWGDLGDKRKEEEERKR